MNISQRLDDLKAQISDACTLAGRRPEEVSLLAVSKTRNAEEIQLALDAGQTQFGENYLQEAIPKVQALPQADWHFIGAIQSNKTRDIANHFNWVHSVSSLKVARRLSEQRDPERNPLKILIQVNISGEASKSGLAPEQVSNLVQDMPPLKGISLQGLMAIPEAGTDTGLVRQRFASLRQLRDQLSDQHDMVLPHLSMGMTNDFPIAIMEGATWIRIGTAIFGPRINKSDINISAGES